VLENSRLKSAIKDITYQMLSFFAKALSRPVKELIRCVHTVKTTDRTVQFDGRFIRFANFTDVSGVRRPTIRQSDAVSNPFVKS